MPTKTVEILTRITPIQILIDVRIIAHDTHTTEKKRIRATRTKNWQERWAANTQTRRLHELIPEVGKWINRVHAKIEHHITQVLCGPGCFGEYLVRIAKAVNAYCHYCPGQDTAGHNLFLCLGWRR